MWEGLLVYWTTQEFIDAVFILLMSWSIHCLHRFHLGELRAAIFLAPFRVTLITLSPIRFCGYRTSTSKVIGLTV